MKSVDLEGDRQVWTGQHTHDHHAVLNESETHSILILAKEAFGAINRIQCLQTYTQSLS